MVTSYPLQLKNLVTHDLEQFQNTLERNDGIEEEH